MTAGRVEIPMRGLEVAVGVKEARAIGEEVGAGVPTVEAVSAALAVDVSAVVPCAIASGAVPCPCRSRMPPRGAAAGSTTSTANAAAAPIRT
jgi:hypothetical protein